MTNLIAYSPVTRRKLKDRVRTIRRMAQRLHNFIGPIRCAAMDETAAAQAERWCDTIINHCNAADRDLEAAKQQRRPLKRRRKV